MSEEEVPEWKKVAQAMRVAADETGCDFMTSPLSVIVDTLVLAQERLATEGTEALPDPGAA